MFLHHVYFWLNEPDNQTSYQQLQKGIETLLAIEPKVMGHLGIPATTNRPVIDTSYQFSLLLIFNDLKDQESYQEHPIHLKFVEDCSALWSKVLIYDSVDPN